MLKSLTAVVLLSLSVAIGASESFAAAAGKPDAKGTVTSISAGSISIRSDKGKTHTFRLTSSTTVEKFGKRLAVADVKPGSTVKIEYSADGSMTATSITLGIATPNGPYFSDREKGPVITIKQDTLVITANNGKPYGFHLAPTTRFERLGQKIAPRAIKVGDHVKVKFDIALSGQLTATSIRLGVKTATGFAYDNKEEGKLTALSTAGLTLANDKGEQLSFHLAPKTKFKKNGRRTRRATLRIGDAVKVKFDVGSDGSLTAVSVTIGTVTGGQVSFPKKAEGRVRAISPTRLTLRTGTGKLVAVRLSRGTLFERAGRRVKRQVVKVGATVKVTYRKTPQGKMALVVRLAPASLR